MIWAGLDARWKGYWNDSLVQSFAISLALHITTFSGLEVGYRMGWWQARFLPGWIAPRLLQTIRSATSVPAKPAKAMANPEPPLLFVEVEPARETEEVPKDAKFYSSRNSVAANPDPRSDSQVPKIDGTQTKIVRTTTVPRSQAMPLQPTPPPPPKPEPKPETKPAPAETVPPSQDDPPPGNQDVAPSRPKPDDGAALVGSEASHSEPRVRPRTLAEARQQRGLIAGEAMQQDGGVKRRGLMSSLDVKATPFGSYDAAIIAAIQKRWFDLLEEINYAGGHTGRVVLEFRLTSDGRITHMAVAENTVGEMLCLICQRGVLDPAPYAPWPSDMRRLVQADYRDVRFTFYYD